MRVIVSGVVAFVLMFLLFGKVDNDNDSKKTKIYHIEATVTSTGQCDKGKCGIAVKNTSGVIEYVTIDKPVAVGQTLYKMCWTEKRRGNMCYLHYSTEKETS